jgi:hypothetical protein
LSPQASRGWYKPAVRAPATQTTRIVRFIARLLF